MQEINENSSKKNIFFILEALISLSCLHKYPLFRYPDMSLSRYVLIPIYPYPDTTKESTEVPPSLIVRWL